MKIIFLWDWEPFYLQALTWQDGLAAAIKELSSRHEVYVVTVAKPGEATLVKHPYFDILVTDTVVEDIKALKPDVILHWADMTRPHAKPLSKLGIPMALCFSGGDVFSYNTDLFQHIFVESDIYLQKLRDKNHSVSVAFGTNTQLFQPMRQAKVFDTIFPATFAAWKRHDLYAHATKGLKSLAVGHMYQDHEQECWQVCIDNEVTVLPHVSSEVMHYLYAASKVCVITSESVGGSQRTVLEAMAMNLPVVITDSDKYDFAQDYVTIAEPNPEELRVAIDGVLDKDTDTRSYVVDKWSEITYADALERGLSKIV